MNRIGIGILGFGTVGAGVAKGLLENADVLRERTGLDLRLARIADLDVATDRGVAVPPGVLCTDAFAAVRDPAVQVVVELIGGTGVAKKLVEEALRAGKPVVTANKKLLAESGAELFALAAEKGVDLFFGASVGGGIPVIRAVRDGLAGCRVEKLYGILNGTCNYILTAMEKDGAPFADVLAQAQKLGFAEADPTLDVDGFDTLHKAAILAALAFGVRPDVRALPVRGIRGAVEAADIAEARAMGYRVKLLAIVKRHPAALELRVAPTLVPADSMLGSVSGVFNAAMVKSDLDDWTLHYGRGAGRLHDRESVVLVLVLGELHEQDGVLRGEAHQQHVVSRHYVNLSLKDEPGSLAAATGAFAARGVSIRSAVQRGAPEGGFATVVVLTHEARRADLDAALADIAALPACGAAPRSLGIEAFEA